jgi:mRNA-degrading endonuclease RelE of RelBE toxin-antitoxin system
MPSPITEMPYRITMTREAEALLLNLPAREQRLISDGIAARLRDQPRSSSRAIKLLRPNPLAAYELRLGDLRVLYNVDEESAEVVIVIIGRKAGNTLIVEGKEFHEHERDLAE